MALVVKNLPANAGDVRTWVWFLGQEDPLEEEMATLSSILAWKIPWTEEPGGLQSMALQRVEHDWECVCVHIHDFKSCPSCENLLIFLCCTLSSLHNSDFINWLLHCSGGYFHLPSYSICIAIYSVRPYDFYFFLSCVPFIVENITLVYKCKLTISSGLTQINWNLLNVSKMAILNLLNIKSLFKISCTFKVFSKIILNIYDSYFYVSTLQPYLPHETWIYLKRMEIICCQPSITILFFLPHKLISYSGIYSYVGCFLGGLTLKNLPVNSGDSGDMDSIPGWRRSPGGWKVKGNPLQYSCLENPMDRGAQWARVHGVAKSWTWLSD